MSEDKPPQRIWFLNEARVAIPLFDGESPGNPDAIKVIAFDDHTAEVEKLRGENRELLEKYLHIENKVRNEAADRAVELSLEIDQLKAERKALRSK